MSDDFGPMTGGTQYLKATFMGFPKSGKSYTATILAIGVRKHFKLTAPIAYLDTEGSVGYLRAKVFEETKQEPVGKSSRNVNDAIRLIRWAEAGNASVVVIDSVSHLWKNLCDGYLADVNAMRKRKKKDALSRLPFSAWGPVKGLWNEFMDVFLTSKVHVILCGRAAFEYDNTPDEEGQDQLKKVGVKITAEKDTGYESSILIEMERITVRDDHLAPSHLIRRATILGDRFNVLDGKHFDDPTFADFLPHVALLDPAGHAAPDVVTHPDLVRPDGTLEWQDEQRQRTILAEKITAEFDRAGLSGSLSKDAMKTKVALLEECFGTSSKTEIEGRDAEFLRAALDKLTARLAEMKEGSK